MHVRVQVQVLVYIFFEKGGVPVGGGGQREGRPGACCEKCIVTVYEGGGGGVSKVKDES